MVQAPVLLTCKQSKDRAPLWQLYGIGKKDVQPQKLADSKKAFPTTEAEPIQSANLCFLYKLLHMHSSAVDLLVQIFWPEFGAF